MSKLTVADYVADECSRLGIKNVFCLMGDANLDLIGAFARVGMRLIHSRHEQGAVAMADGYARFSGNIIPAVCTVTQGPGLTNTSTAMITAANAGSRVLLFAGDNQANSRDQQFDQHAFSHMISRNAATVSDGSKVPATIQKLLDGYHQGQGPAIASVPAPVWNMPVSKAQRLVIPKVQPVVPTDASVEATIELLKKAKRPVVLAGRGAVYGQAEQVVQTFAERLGAPIVTTIASHGFAARHPLYAGAAGTFSDGVGAQALHDSDCIVAVGASLSHWTLDEYTVIHGKPVIAINLKPQPGPACDITLIGSAVPTLKAVIARLPAKKRAPWFQKPPAPRPAYPHKPGALDPWSVLRTISDSIPPTRPVIFDGGQHVLMAMRTIHVERAQDYAWTGDFGSIGLGLAMAAGAALARPQEQTVVISGDSTFLMGITELETAVRYRLPVAIFVLNDKGYGQERVALAKKGIPKDLATIPTPDIAQLAEAYGATGVRIERAEQLADIPAQLAAAEGPIVFEILTNPDISTDFYERLTAHRELAQRQADELR